MPGTTTPLRARIAREPTGLPNPPMMLLVGPEKSGKSHAAALGTASDLIGMTYWIEIGGSEGTADYYGRLPGARYKIVPHDGTYQDILDAIRWSVAQPPVDGKPNMIVVDNMTVLWDMLSDEQALFARRRAERKAQETRRRAPSLDEPVIVDPDLWNRAKDRWGEVLWMLRRHKGPTLLLARQEIVTEFENDKPTRHKTRKVKAERNLPAAVDAIVELHAIGEAHLTGVRTLHWDITPGQTMPFPDFSVDALLRRLGFEEAAAARQVTEVRPEAYLSEQQPTPSPPAQKPEPRLTGPQVVQMVHKALTDENNPEECLHAIREEWGIRFLREIPTVTKLWGEMNADDLITRSLQRIKEQARQRQEADASSRRPEPGSPGEGRSKPGPPPSEAPPQLPAASPQIEQSAPDESDAPPPDPEAEEPTPAEAPEDTSAAEEPQDVPRAAARRVQSRAERMKNVAREALFDEAEIQARVNFVTVGEHLGPITETGEPGLAELKDFILAQRPKVIALLEEADQPALADLYRGAPIPDLSIKKKFAAYLDGAGAAGW
jgi:hypothetical protein